MRKNKGLFKDTYNESPLRRIGFYERYIKRIFDIVCSILAISVFWWLYAIIAILVRARLGSPILFTQYRPGKNERLFKLYKFRTMTDKRDREGNLLPDNKRLTKFGKLLRSTSLDELPEAFNIIKGDMSIVGPRPLLPSYLDWYTEEERHRHDVRPGLTGLAQVNGRNFINWDKRFALDIKYTKKITFLNDVKIIFKTISKFLHHSNIATDSAKVEGNMAEIRANILKA